MHSIANSSKHDSISMFNIKSHQELMGIKRDVDYDFQHQYQNDNYNQTNYGGIFKGEKIDPKINNSELLINSMIEEQIHKNNSNNQSQYNNNMQELQSPVTFKEFTIISPQNTKDQIVSKYQQSYQEDITNSYQNKDAIKVLDSQNDFNIKSNENLNHLSNIELKNKSSFEEQTHEYQSEKTKDFHLQGQFNSKLQNRTSLINNHIGISSPFKQDNQSQLNGKFIYSFQNEPTDEMSNQNLHLAQRMSRNPSFRIDHNSMVGSQKLLNKNHASNMNIGQLSETQHHQKSEYKKNSITTTQNTKNIQKQSNIYILSILCLRVIKFAKNLFYFSQRQQFKLLNQMKIKIIGDSASFYKYFYYSGQLKQKPSILEVVKYKLKQFVSIRKLNSLISRCLCSKTEVQFLPDFDEGSKAKIIWDIFLLLVTIFNIFTSPLRHSFEAYQDSLLTTNFISTVFALDILLQFRTSYFENGLIISKKSMIVMNYLKGKFIYDFLGLIIFIFSYTFEDLLFMSYLMIYRFISVRKIFNDMENKFQLREKGLAYSTFFQLILSILLVSHYSASIFHYLAQVQHQNGVEQTWLILQTTYDSPWLERYIISLYWSVITIITIGYGDITPRTILERAYVIVFAFVGCGLFGYCINVIGEQVREIGREKSIFKRKSAKLNKFMHMRALNKDLQQKVRKYYEYLFQEEMNEDEEGSNVFNNLTSLLKKQVWIDVYGKLLQQNKIFSTNFSNEFINMLSLKVKEKKFGPEEYIFVNGDSANYIFIIISGEVDQYLQRETIGDQYESLPTLHFINSYKKGDMFGQLEFFSQTKRKSTLKTKCVTSVAYLNYTDFIETLDKFELDKEVYYQIKDQINIYKNYSNIDLKCPICSEYRHKTHECNSINFILYKEKLIDLAQKSEIQNRQDKSIVSKEKMEYQKKNKTSHSFRMIETCKEIPLRRGAQKKIAQDKYNAYVNNFEVKTQGFKIIVDILAEQIKETLSKEEEETILQQQFGSSEIKEAESQIQDDKNPQQQEEISVSEEQQEEGSSFQNSKPHTFSHSHFYNNQQQHINNLERRRSSFFSQKQIHEEVIAEQEESLQNMTSLNRDSRKCKTVVLLPKSSQKSLQHQDSDRRIQICRSQQKIDYTYALQSDVNPFYIPQAYVADEIFNFPEDIVTMVCGKNQKTVQFQGSPTRFQNQISGNSIYNKQQSKNSDLNSQVSSSNSSISPTIFQPLSLRHIDSKVQYPNFNSSSYSNSNSFNIPSQFPISPVGSQYKNFSQNINNSANLNPINVIRTSTTYSLSPSNTNCQTNPNSINSFGNAIINLSAQQQQQIQDYNQMITQNPFAAQYNQPNSPYSNRLGTYGIYLPALQQLEPINEMQSKEIISSSSEENNEEDITPARKSDKGSKILSNQPLPNGRRQSKEPSIKLHVKQKDQQSTGNSQFIGSNGTIGYHHMEAISPMKIQQPPSQESIQIQRGFSSEQDTTNQDDKMQTNTLNYKSRIPSSQHVQFAEDEDEILQNNSGGTLNNQNTLQTFEQAQQNIKNSQKQKKSKRSNHKPSKFSNNQYTYNSFVSQMSQLNQQKANIQNLNEQQKNVLFTRSLSQQNLNQINNATNNINNIFNQHQNTNFQGSGTVLNSINGNNNMNNNILNNAVANFQQQLLGANNGLSSQFSWQYDPSSLYSKLMSRQSIQMKFKKDQDFCALIYKKRINLKGIDNIYEEVYNNFDVMRNYTVYFWHNNFSYISQINKQKFFRKKYHSSLATTKLRKQSKTNETNQNKNTNRTSVQFHLTRANTNLIQQQSTIRTTNRLSQGSIFQNPQLLYDNKFGKNKIINI
ncbi:cyclic nucleotide-binding domain protein (macronuclear) [Tetrahymena thermophila SB210]|uniref:Cyclic nucleotide-binding domain protein n=1 Tax=Tetrahymena thermophila (strain SB210) TaxID=312017 RepID=A4VEU4_TETTS|nr:cyclic nucleotide-binding domain protein [Tetrahymena thermophila SB210]EDK32040.2 cyclic nucleotide-binding domain protein [Tetrahymena thermophila SB210]|eukprot:XP_001470712.2 cyclic nucleotide-binding domain protein [Tetrahymena thermophila SB210]